jgi:hypothetical protein
LPACDCASAGAHSVIPISVAQINGAALERGRKLLVLIGFSLCDLVVPVRHPTSWRAAGACADLEIKRKRDWIQE